MEDKEAEFGRIDVQNVTTQWGVFAIAGPKSRDVMNAVIRDADPATALSNKRFPWLSAKQIELGMCPVNAIRVAYTGELGWELHLPVEYAQTVYEALHLSEQEQNTVSTCITMIEEEIKRYYVCTQSLRRSRT